MLICWHTAWEHDYFGDGSCHACQTGHYELFDIEHIRNGGEFYYYRCNDVMILKDMKVIRENNKDMKMNHKFYIWLIGVIIGIGICWQLLEILIYGEIQPRIIDDYY